ncbi:MAG TPA: helix-turn-helix domain-containing protein [Segetibacter sp.]|jgi:HTH-type transcriptional regulator/antitoxin HigA
MDLKAIRNEKDYEDYLTWVDEMFDAKVTLNTREGEKLEVALILIKQYEDEHYSIPTPNPIDAIKLKMEEKGLKNRDLVEKIGSKGYISALLNKQKPLTLNLARKFHKELGIPAEVFLA